MSSRIQQAELARRQQAAIGVGAALLATMGAYGALAVAQEAWPLVGLLGGLVVVVCLLLFAARSGRVRLAGYGYSFIALGGVVGGAAAWGAIGFGPFYLVFAVVLASVTLEPKDLFVVFVLGIGCHGVLALLPERTGSSLPLGGTIAQGTTLYFLVGSLALATSVSFARLLGDLHRRDADALAADRRADQLARQLETNQRMEALGRLAGGIAHDFNNLLSVVQSCADLVQAGLATAAPELEDLRDLRAAVDRGAELTRHLLAFSRRDVVKLGPVDAGEVTRGLREILKRLVGKNVQLTIESTSSCVVWASTPQIEQTLINLAVNARDAMDGSGSLELRVARADDARIGKAVRIAVTDSGPGVPEAIRTKMFEPFFTTKPAGKGTGLGLSTTYGIVTRYGGRVEVESPPSGGARFVITLPEYTGASDEAQDVSPPPLPREVGSTRLWIVDDEPLLLGQMQRALGPLGFRVRSFQNAEEVLEAAKDEQCDVLVTDIGLPRLSGVVLAERLMARWPGMRVVLISGFAADPSATAQLVSRGAVFVSKPFAPEQLKSAVLGP